MPAGTIPTALGDLLVLGYLALSSNALTGECVAILVIRLIRSPAMNVEASSSFCILLASFTGPIPSELGSLSVLRQLWLQKNKLSSELVGKT